MSSSYYHPAIGYLQFLSNGSSSGTLMREISMENEDCVASLAHKGDHQKSDEHFIHHPETTPENHGNS